MTHPTDEHVGERLKKRRAAMGLTQSDVADHLGISFQQIQKYELGRNRISASKIFDTAKTPEEAALLANYRALNQSTRAAVSNILDAAAKAQEAQPEVAA